MHEGQQYVLMRGIKGHACWGGEVDVELGGYVGPCFTHILYYKEGTGK